MYLEGSLSRKEGGKRKKKKGEKSESQNDATWKQHEVNLAGFDTGGAMSPRMQAASRGQIGKRKDSSWEFPEGNTALPTSEL